MTFNRKSYKSYTKEYYRCGTYTNKGTDACGSHTILSSTLYTFVANDIRNYAKLAYNDENKLIERLVKSNGLNQEKNLGKYEKAIKVKEHRVKEIDNLTQSLFEEKINGTVPENIFIRMAKKYDDEQLTLSKEVIQLKSELVECRRTEKDIESWVAKIKKCLTIETLTREIVVELIDSIEVSEKYKKDGEEHQDISVTYRFESFSNKEKRAS